MEIVQAIDICSKSSRFFNDHKEVSINNVIQEYAAQECILLDYLISGPTVLLLFRKIT